MSRLKKHLQRSAKNQEEVDGRKFVATVNDTNAEKELSRHLSQDNFQPGQFEILGQFNLGFIVVRLLKDDLFIVDQHAADEKFRFETLNKTIKRVTQPLVCPQVIHLDAGKREILKSNLTLLQNLGKSLILKEKCSLSFVSVLNFRR